jgi:hypothetical protein
VDNKALSVVAVRVNDCLPAGINGGDTAPTPTGFTQNVSDDFPLPTRQLLLFRSTDGNKGPKRGAVPKFI